MKILLIYPEYPDTFWSFKYALNFVSKKAMMPPLGLLTIASMLPEDFETRLIDMNVSKLTEKDILRADFVFISAMITQKDSAKKIIETCKKLGKKTVVGGPLFTGMHHEFPGVDYFVLDEGETTFPLFLKDLKENNLQRVYTSNEKPDITKAPVPKWELVDLKKYNKMPLQYSRGCPFDCEFCDVVRLNGKNPRTKTPLQVIKELNALVRSGWSGSVFIVDDNFIGNKAGAKKLLKAIARWRKMIKSRAIFMTEVSLNIADDDELLLLMKNAGFNSVFIGLETPSEESLAECGKFQNTDRNLVESVKKLYRHGLEVTAGFIVGFDSDDDTIFKRQIEFIQKSGVVVAMIGLLQALPGTRLYERLKLENRLITSSSGNNTDFSINFLSKINPDKLIEGYKSIISNIYSYKYYYERVHTFLKEYKQFNSEKVELNTIMAFLKSIFILGIFEKDRKYYWKMFFTGVFKYPKSFPKIMAMAIYYFHFRKIFLDIDKCSESA
jgi:radical SAM superfamily enzyme YgiQ (UPF0313 family)